jgi:hypothetical protein
MFLPATWSFLENYEDLITNGLDLPGFLLATPEVARIFVPSLYKLLYFAYFNFMILSGAVLAASDLVKRLEADTNAITTQVLLLLFICGLLGLGNFARFAFRYFTLPPAAEQQLGRIALGTGLMLLLPSRAIAFLISAHEIPWSILYPQ